MRNVFCLLCLVMTIPLLSPPVLAGECRPVATDPPNARDQEPHFPHQARACEKKTNVPLKVEVLAEGLEHPWAVEVLDDDEGLLVTERAGRLRHVSPDGKLSEPIQGLPEVFAQGQGGLLDVIADDDFDDNRRIYWSFSEPREGGNTTAVARGTLSRDYARVEDVEIIFRAEPVYDGDKHFGSRLLIDDDDDHLYITLGERSDMPMREYAQRLDSHLGSVLRVTTDGKPARGNPFMNRQDAKPEIWSYGHRNIQAAAFDDDERLWVIEHGANGGDELNLVKKGANYGWPRVAYGIEYSGEPIRGAATHKEGFEPPVYYWDPVIGPSGALFHDGDMFEEWEDDLLIGGLVATGIVRLDIRNRKVVGEERLLTERGRRIRDIAEGDDGELYVVTDEANGQLWKVTRGR